MLLDIVVRGVPVFCVGVVGVVAFVVFDCVECWLLGGARLDDIGHGSEQDCLLGEAKSCRHD